MLRFLMRRLGLMIIVLLLVSVIIFSLLNVLPGDPAMLILGQESSPEALDALREKMGLNDALHVQYLSWLTDSLRGDFGNSLRDNNEVTSILMKKVPITIQLAFMAFLVAILIAMPAAIISATRKGTTLDYFSTFFSLSGVSIPPFWLGILLILVFSVGLGWLPPSGYVSLAENPLKSTLLMLMPAIALGIRLAAELTRMLRSSLLEVLQSDYIRTGYAKGLMEKAVVFRHALRNSLIPVITISGLQFATLIGGVVIIETIFSIPGIGQLVYSAILARDFPVVQGAVMLMAFSVVLINFLVDVAYSVLDPRIKLGGEK